MSLLIRTIEDASWHRPKVTAYTNEKELQDIIVDSPSLLPGVPEAGVLAVAEVGFVDVLCLDPDGGITICECKLKTNPEIRRKIVGQLLAYAAELWRTPYEVLDRRIAACTKDPRSIIDRMEGLAAEAGNSDWNSEGFRKAVSDNLAEGRFRLVFAVDEITDELKRIVEFTHAHSSTGFAVMAVEIGYVRDVGVVEILTPTTYGEELKQSKGEHGKSVWDGATFVAALRARAPEEAAGIEAIMRWAEQDRVADLYGTGKDGSVPGLARPRDEGLSHQRVDERQRLHQPPLLPPVGGLRGGGVQVHARGTARKRRIRVDPEQGLSVDRWFGSPR